ncbi:MAG TPA: branched-chain amino acid transporter AzlC [Ruminococcaceae bacterium]|nr:branched-chain amino acid transporter AzlC [Oscillospiraceae bacterium]
MTKTTLKRAFKDSLPILAGYLALGMGFGVMLQSKGYSFWWALLMSCTMFAGSGQYAGVDFLASGATILTTAVMTFIINARHFFYGFSLLDKYKGAGALKPYMIFGLTDETYSIVCSAKLDETINPKKYYFFLTALNHLYWITGCTLGAVLGEFLPFDSKGIDFAMTALFIVIMVEQWMSTKEHLPALLGIATTVVCLIIFGADMFIIPSMVLIAAELLLFRKKLDKTGAGEKEADKDD